MFLRELELELPVALGRSDALAQIRDAIRLRLPSNAKPIRFAVTNSDADRVSCAISSLEELPELGGLADISIFDFSPRKHENISQFNVVFLVPTGIGAEIGGHAGMRRRPPSCSRKPATH